jgi:hypothetical protein
MHKRNASRMISALPARAYRVTMSPTSVATVWRRRQLTAAGGIVRRAEQERNRPLVIQVRFEPSRLAMDYLIAAYEYLVPIRRRSVRSVAQDPPVLHEPAPRADDRRRAC